MLIGFLSRSLLIQISKWIRLKNLKRNAAYFLQLICVRQRFSQSIEINIPTDTKVFRVIFQLSRTEQT